ncbi:cadherin-13-like [Scyliorhinus torazame]|uniref:cadherin-13-like n=1 Tax=Scyliorhinus torazame TaxID=75743 RepID=UPI003B5AF083
MEHETQLTLAFLLVQVLLQAFAVNLDCTPGFQEKKYQVLQSSDYIKDQFILKVHFDDCSGNEGLEFAISNPGLRVEADGSVFAVKSMEATMSGFIIQATSIHAQDSADVQVVRGEDNHSSVLKEALKIGNISILHRRKRSLIAPPISFPENQRGPFPKIIGRIITDRIEGIKFQLHGKGVEEEPKGVFKINDQSGEIIVTRSLDREEMDMYILQVETTDSTGKLLEGPASLLITIIDQNDNKPLFREGPYVGHVLESSPTGTTVMRMTAYDADDPNTDNAVLRYSITKQTPATPSPNMFYIDPEKGDIVTVVPPSILDREIHFVIMRVIAFYVRFFWTQLNSLFELSLKMCLNTNRRAWHIWHQSPALPPSQSPITLNRNSEEISEEDLGEGSQLSATPSTIAEAHTSVAELSRQASGSRYGEHHTTSDENQAVAGWLEVCWITGLNCVPVRCCVPLDTLVPQMLEIQKQSLEYQEGLSAALLRLQDRMTESQSFLSQKRFPAVHGTHTKAARVASAVESLVQVVTTMTKAWLSS